MINSMMIKVYLSKDKSCVQVINPSEKFEGSVSDLVSSINYGRNFGYEVVKD